MMDIVEATRTRYMALTEELPTFLSQALLQCKNLPAMPSTALKVLMLARTPRATLGDYARTIECDPALTLRLVTLANSAYYSRVSQATGCLDAVQQLGLDTTLVAVLSFSLLPPSADHYRQRAWQRSITAALIAQRLTERYCADARGSVYTAALLQDIGILALQAAYPSKAATLYGDAELSHHQIEQLERTFFNGDHALVGAWLAAKWGAPDTLVDAIRGSHAEIEPSEPAQLCVRLSGPLADTLLAPNPAAMLARILPTLERLALCPPLSLKNLFEHVQSQLKALSEALTLPAASTLDIQALLAEAQELLFEHTLEMERRQERRERKSAARLHRFMPHETGR
ncbi:HDOD domain-containing protein [Halomonas dongshanensis]|uniref:HDOD domain-containing protein n=1 Tax=Halomonas dongshanensis TaxID=2890835 RepID=A0ABT2E9A7_9GAMM|nr:HDOD domain-containing protein [Halomonas dongshanensis]MCS2608159.1 HDOD domain-containing protein [Halomonas dongshanensis]